MEQQFQEYLEQMMITSNSLVDVDTFKVLGSDTTVPANQVIVGSTFRALLADAGSSGELLVEQTAHPAAGSVALVYSYDGALWYKLSSTNGGGGAASAVGTVNLSENITNSGPVIHFDGTTDSITVPDDVDLEVGTSDFAIGIKFKLDTVSGTQYLCNKEAAGIGYGIYLTDDDILIRIDDGTTDTSGIILTAKVVADVWYSLIVNFDRSGNATAYLNNLGISGTVAISTSALTLVSAGALLIGATTAGASFFGGDISWFKLFNTTLTYQQSIDIINNPDNVEFLLLNADNTEHLNETAFASHANWDVTGDIDDSGGNATYTWASNTTSTLTQVNADMALAVVAQKKYRFTYDLAETVAFDGDGAITITTGIAATAVTIPLVAGTGLFVEFETAAGAATGDFVISIVSGSDTVGTYVLDNVSLLQVGEIGSWMPSGMGTSTWYEVLGRNNGSVGGTAIINQQATTTFKNISVSDTALIGDITTSTILLTGATVGGTADAITLNYSPDAVISTGTKIGFFATADNTGAATINVDGAGVKAIEKDVGGVGTPLAAADIRNGGYLEAVYNGTEYIVITNLGN